jgi:hypothetical protein
MLMVPLRTLAGSSGEPGQLSRIGPVTPVVAQELAGAAATDATCEWRVIVVGPRGQPLVVTRIRSPGCGPAGQPGRDGPPGQAGPGLLGRVIVIVPAGLLDPRYPASAWDQGAGHLAGVIRAVLRAGQGAMDSEAAVDKAGTCPGPCGHEHSVPGYRIPGRLRAFIEARDHDCGYPVCRRPAASCDIDHTTPYDQGGLTCRCNLSPLCRRHHQAKQAAGWQLIQPTPGVLVWRLPHGRSYQTGPEP